MPNLSKSNLSRRHALCQFLTVAAAGAAGAALAPVAQAAVVPASANAAAIPETASTPIAALWAEHKRISRRYRALTRESDKLDGMVAVKMPKPHPSITESPENDAFGLKPSHPGYGNRLHGYISSDIIEREMRNVLLAHYHAVVRPGGPPFDWYTTPISSPGVSDAFEWVQAHFDDPLLLPLTPEQTTRMADLITRLRLSREYAQQVKRVERAVGIPGNERDKEKAIAAMSRIERRIYKLPAQTTGDTRIKLALYQYDHDECGGDTHAIAESLVRDLRRSLKQQTAA
jgi:hypothetical protein